MGRLDPDELESGDGRRPARAPALERRNAVRAAVLSGLALTIAVVILAATQGGPAYFLQLGPETPGLPKVIEVLGDDVPLPLADGHDGDRFWQLARDPLLRDDDSLGEYLDRPVYRSQRIGYPALAAPWRAAGEQALLWGMVLTNVALLAFGTYALGRWSADAGGPGVLGYAFALNPVVWASVLFDLGDAMALAGLVLALWGASSRRPWLTVVGAIAGTLAKESVLLGLGAAAVLTRGLSLRIRALLVVPAGMVALAWRVYVMSRPRLGTDPEVQEFTVVPFGGFVRSWRLAWWPDAAWGDLVVAVALVALCVTCAWAWATGQRSLWLAAALPYVVMAPFLSGQVVSVWLNIVRAVGPVITLYLAHRLVVRVGKEGEAGDGGHPLGASTPRGL